MLLSQTPHAYVVVPEAPRAAPCRWDFGFIDVFSKETNLFYAKKHWLFGYDPPNRSSPHCSGSAWWRVAPQNVPNGPPFELQFLQKLVSQTFFHNTYGICHLLKVKKQVMPAVFSHCLQIFVLSFSLSQTTSNYHGWLSTGTFSSAEKSSQGMRVAPRLPGKGQRPTNPPAMTPTESCLVKTLSVLEGFFILSFLVGGFNPSDKY